MFWQCSEVAEYFFLVIIKVLEKLLTLRNFQNNFNRSIFIGNTEMIVFQQGHFLRLLENSYKETLLVILLGRYAVCTNLFCWIKKQLVISVIIFFLNWLTLLQTNIFRCVLRRKELKIASKKNQKGIRLHFYFPIGKEPHLSQKHINTLSLSYTHTHTNPHTHLTHAHTYSHILTHTVCLSFLSLLSLSPSVCLSLSHTHTLTHISLSYPSTHSLSDSLSLSNLFSRTPPPFSLSPIFSCSSV